MTFSGAVRGHSSTIFTAVAAPRRALNFVDGGSASGGGRGIAASTSVAGHEPTSTR